MDAKTLKSLIKSAEATVVSETAMLDQYLSTKGVNPKYAPKNLKVAHSKTNAFKKWSRDHSDEMRKKQQLKGKVLQLQGEEVELDEGQKWPDNSTSLSKRKIVVPNLAAHRSGQTGGSKAGRPGGMTVATRVEPTITSTKVKKIDDDKPVPSFLKKEEFEEDTTVLEEILDFMQTEEYAQLDEISKKTLNSYIDKSTHDDGTGPEGERKVNKGRESGVTKAAYRTQGLAHKKGTDGFRKYAAEEVEQIDELSKDTLKSYVKKVDDKVGALGKMSDRYSGRSDDKGRGLYYAIRKNQATKQHAKGVEGAEKRLAKEDVEQLDELSTDTLKSYIGKAKKEKDYNQAVYKMRSPSIGADKIHSEYDPKRKDKINKRTTGIGQAHSKVIDNTNKAAMRREATEADYGGKHQANVLALKAKAEKKPVDMKSLAARMQASYAKDKEKSVKEDIDPLDETWKYHTYHDNDTARAATKAHHSYRDEKGMASGNPARAMGNGKVAYKGEFKGPKPVKPFKEEADQIDESTRKQELSKSARMIKALYKKHKVVKEEIYDKEKDDKPKAAYGKSPTHTTTDDKESSKEDKSNAAAVLSGGTTLTGQKRDDIEIDPMMRLRPGQPDPSKEKANGAEKADKKKDK